MIQPYPSNAKKTVKTTATHPTGPVYATTTNSKVKNAATASPNKSDDTAAANHNTFFLSVPFWIPNAATACGRHKLNALAKKDVNAKVSTKRSQEVATRYWISLVEKP